MQKKGEEFLLEYKHNYKVDIITFLIFFVFVLLFYLSYLAKYGLSDRGANNIFSYYYDILFLFILILLSYGLIRSIRIMQKKTPNEDKKIMISDKNIIVTYESKKDKEVVEWKNVKYVKEINFPNYIYSRVSLDLVYLDKNDNKKILHLISRYGRYGIQPNINIDSDYKLLDKKEYENIFNFFSKKTKIKKSLIKFRKEKERIE